MDHSDVDLQELVATGKSQGYLTYDQVNDYLPDEAVTPEKLDNLLIALEQLGIELVNEPPELDAAVSDPQNSDPPAADSKGAARKAILPIRHAENESALSALPDASCPSSATIRCGCT